MNWTDPNNSTLIWSLSAKDITLSSNGSTVFEVAVRGDTRARFTLTPVNGQIRLRLREILDAVLPIETIRPDLFVQHVALAYQVTITATRGTETADWSAPCLRGGVGGLETGMGIVLQGGGSSRILYPDSTEFLSVTAVRDGLVDGKTVAGIRLRYILYREGMIAYRNGISFTGIGLTYSLPAVCTIGFSLKSVLAEFGILHIPSQRPYALSASVLYFDEYDALIREGALHYYYPKPADGRVREFLYINSAGAPQRIYARGKRTETLEVEPLLFLRDGVDLELQNGARRKETMDSGYLTSRDERMIWEEFFRSRTRYVVEGGSYVPIVMDEVSSEMARGELTAVSFTYHVSKRYEGYISEEPEA